MDHHDNLPRDHHGEEEHEHHKEKDANDLVNIEVKAKSHDRDGAHEKHSTSSDERRDWGPSGANRSSGEGAKMTGGETEADEDAVEIKITIKDPRKIDGEHKKHDSRDGHRRGARMPRRAQASNDDSIEYEPSWGTPESFGEWLY